MSLHLELQNFVDSGLTPFEALLTATLWSARTIGVEEDVGTLEASNLDDMVIVDVDPLTHIQDAWNVTEVFKNGIRYKLEDGFKLP